MSRDDFTATPFGRSMLRHWPLDPEITYLNHGTVGSPPRLVLAAQQALRDEIERQPARFLLRELTEIRVGGPRTEPPRLRTAAAAVAAFVGARGEDLVFVDNTTTGANAVLRSFPLAPGDRVLVTDHGYGGVTRAAIHAARLRGAEVATCVLPYPRTTPEGVLAAIEAALAPATRLALIDHVTSESALLLPVAEIAALCRARGVALLVDGAHAPGALALDVPAIGADWYVANLHKWAWTPRSSGFLWAAPGRAVGVHPAVVSWGLDQGFAAEFDLPGTRDPTPHLAAPAALDLLAAVGCERVWGWNHDLAWRGARLLADAWNVPFETPESMIGTMATLPLPPALGSSDDNAARVRDALLFEDRIEVQVHDRADRLWVRVGAQIYNELDDFARLAEAVAHRAAGSGTGRG